MAARNPVKSLKSSTAGIFMTVSLVFSIDFIPRFAALDTAATLSPMSRAWRIGDLVKPFVPIMLTDAVHRRSCYAGLCPVQQDTAVDPRGCTRGRVTKCLANIASLLSRKVDVRQVDVNGSLVV